MEIGARYSGEGKCRFTVWAPFSERVTLCIAGPEEREIQGKKDSLGYWLFGADDLFPGANYLFRLDNGTLRPDPASHFQPKGVHGPSQVMDHVYPWSDAGWSGVPLEEMIVYELHVGTFTEEGSFEAVIPRLNDLHDLGITALEIMPVGQFPGERNWGYDGAYPFAVQNSYGGPQGLKRLVDACHGRGLAVILDVVYNHLGPEGNYLREFGPYFTEKYSTPWGGALNFDDA
jgi:maltooligosyltrehalose trehalohydrolase